MSIYADPPWTLFRKDQIAKFVIDRVGQVAGDRTRKLSCTKSQIFIQENKTLPREMNRINTAVR